MKYIEVSIRITLPPEISAPIHKEKQRFVTEYGSEYKSEPHITLYLARYTEDGLLRLPADLEAFNFTVLTFTILEVTVSEQYGKNNYIIDVSNKNEIEELHNQVTEVASKYQSPLLRAHDQARLDKGIPLTVGSYVPHITLGTVPADVRQPNLKEVNENLKTVQGKQVFVSDVTIFFYGKEAPEEKARLIKEIKVSLVNEAMDRGV